MTAVSRIVRCTIGKSSKPLLIQIDKSLHDATPEQWGLFIEQGYDIQVIDSNIPDLYLAPYAMRMTADMLNQLPAALKLAIQGARALRYAPHGAIVGKGKKGVKAAKPRKGRNTTKQAEAPLPGQLSIDAGELPVEGEVEGTGEGAIDTASDTSNYEGNGTSS